MDWFGKQMGQHTCPGGTKCKDCGKQDKPLVRRLARRAMKRDLKREVSEATSDDD